MRGKKDLEGVWLGRGEEKKGRAQVGPPESFLPKMGRKLLESLIY